MILTSKPVMIDLLYLLFHEPNKLVYHPFDETYLADAINKRIEDTLDSIDKKLQYVKFTPPRESGLSRWYVTWKFWDLLKEEDYVADRGVSSAAEIRKELPPEVVAVLRASADWTVDVANPSQMTVQGRRAKR